MATTEAAVDNVEPSSTVSEKEKSIEKVSENEAPEVAEPTRVDKEIVNGEKKEGPAIESNAEDIRSEEEEDIEGSLVLDDFLDSLDVLDSWNPDEDELEGIGDEQTQQSPEKEKKSRDDKHRRERSRDKGSSRKDLDDKRSTRRRSSHRDRSGGDLLELLQPKTTRKRSVHRECSLERPIRPRHHVEGGKEVKDLRDLLSRRDHRDIRDHRDKSRDKSRDHRRDYRDRDREKDRHKEKEKSKEKIEKVVEKPKEVKGDNEVKPPPGVVPVPRVKMPSDDLVPPGTEDEFWPQVDVKVEPSENSKNGSVKEMETEHRRKKRTSGVSSSGSTSSNKKNSISFSNAGHAELVYIAREWLKRKVNSEEASLARTWACKLKRMKSDQKLLAEKFINDILFEAELGTLRRNSVSINNISLSSSPATSLNLDSSL